MTARKRKTRVTAEMMMPSNDLARIVGDAPKSRTQIAKAIWEYIDRHGLQDQRYKRNINADARLAKIFGGKRVVSMFELAAMVESHLRRADDKMSPERRVRGKSK
ncbi:MAG: hypothetical protein ABS52_01605 [Gemmatimonadetes bacterium SCN 70-22]|nr:MAG: hypothetical protein ABS52_01605 [Gemmatimonadetes bacterium SCN 70-22]